MANKGDAKKSATTSKKVTKKSTKVASKKATKQAGGKAKTAKTAKTTKKATKKTTKKVAKKATKKVAKKTTKQTGGSSTTRYFKVVTEGGDPHGRFSGAKPKQAANKALTSLLKSKEKTGKSTNGEIKFSIVECTRGSKHKTYNYVGERVELENPMEVVIGSGADKKTIKYKFNNKVMKDKSA